MSHAAHMSTKMRTDLTIGFNSMKVIVDLDKCYFGKVAVAKA